MSGPDLHPSKEELNAFSLGQLATEAAEQVEQHINTCAPCCETMLALSSDDTFVELLQGARKLAGKATTLTSQVIKDVRVNDPWEIPVPLAAHSRYEVQNLIGRGGMGRVFKARHRMMDRTVALKVIDSQWVQKPEVIDRFKREVKAAASLSHPNIVTAHDAEQADNLHFLAMEFVDGIDLAQTIRDHGPLSVATACDYIRQAAEGLQYAHDRGMVHRDIKPHNLMITKDSVIKILDFGLASLAPRTATNEPSGEHADGNLTIDGAIMGTPDFISPEQARDASRVDGRSDIYSLGMTLYYLLAGRAPFSAGHAIEKLKLHAEADPAPLSEFRNDVPEALQRIVSQMIAKDPSLRFQSPKEVAATLRALAQTELQQQAVVSARQGGGRFRPVRKLLVAAGGLFAAALFGIIFFLQTNHGLIRLEVLDPNLKVEVKNEEITINSDQPVKIRPGQHHLLIEDGGKEFPFEAGEFSVKRGESVVVTIQRLNGSLQVAKDGTVIWSKSVDEGKVKRTDAPAVAAAEEKTMKPLNAGEIMQQLFQVHGNPVPKLTAMISEAAGIPNGQWNSFARNPTASASSIKGEPFSLVMLGLNPLEEKDPAKLKEFRFTNELPPKPRELTEAMSASRHLGYHSILQEQDLQGLTYEIKSSPLNKAQLVGNVRFESEGLYSGKVHFVITIDENADLTVSELSLPNYGVKVVRGENGLWKKETTGVEEKTR